MDELSEKIVEQNALYQNDMTEKENELETLKDIINNLNLEKEQLVSKNENLRSQLSEKESQTKSMYHITDKKSDIRSGDRKASSKVEAELWAELNKAKEKLAKANEKLEMYATEKARFIETMRRNEGEGDNLKQLMEKENEISNLQILNKQLQTSHDENLRMVGELQARLKILEKQNETYRCQLSEGQKDTEELIIIYQDKLKIALKEYEKCESEVVDLKHRLHILDTGLREHQKMIVERDQMLVAAQDNKNELSIENDNLRRYVKHLRCQLTELSEDHAMKLGELHCTYCLLEEKTNYVSKLESSLSCTDTKQPTVSNLTSQTRGHSFVTERSDSDRLSSDTNTMMSHIKKTDYIIDQYKHRKLMRTSSEPKSYISHHIKLKPKNFSTTCNFDGDKLLERDYVEDVTIMRLTDMILNTLAHKQKQYEFVKHASTLALFEAKRNKSIQNLDEKVRDCALFYNSPVYGEQRDVVIQFLKTVQFDINRVVKRNATLPNCCIYS